MMTGKHAKTYDVMADINGPTITDHGYSGNVCVGFGGRFECRTQYGCEGDPYSHYRAKHRAED